MIKIVHAFFPMVFVFVFSEVTVDVVIKEKSYTSHYRFCQKDCLCIPISQNMHKSLIYVCAFGYKIPCQLQCESNRQEHKNENDTT